MKIWFDCNTSKHALLFSCIAERIEKELGYECIFTCRDHEFAPSVLANEGRDPEVIGEYGGGSLKGKLLASVKRTKELAQYIVGMEEQPDFAVYLNSPEAARVAFGLALPSFCFNDTPHAKATITLVIPFSNHLILPEFIPIKPYVHLAPREKITKYPGLDAIELFRDFKPDRGTLQRLGIDPARQIILFRPEEAFASFYKSERDPLPRGEALFRMVKRKTDSQWVILPRYKEHWEFFKNFGDHIIVPEGAVDTRSLETFADVVVTGGSTMAEEAAVQGTPAVSYYPERLYSWRWMRKNGFPIYDTQNIYDASELILDILDDPQEYGTETSGIVSGLKSPSDVLLEKIREET